MNQITETLRHQMEEAAALPADDPRREEVVRQLLAAGPEAEQVWLDLSRETEQWRLALRHVDPPEGLHRRLHAIPAEAPAASRRLVLRAWLVSAIAATVLVAVSAVWITGNGGANAAPAFAALAVDKHLNDPSLTVQSSDPAIIEASFQGHLPYEVRMPHTTINASYQLIGGSMSMLGEKPVVYTRWTRNDQMFALYQFCSTDFRMPERIAEPITVLTPRPGQSDYQVTLWSEAHCAYALVEEQPGQSIADDGAM